MQGKESNRIHAKSAEPLKAKGKGSTAIGSGQFKNSKRTDSNIKALCDNLNLTAGTVNRKRSLEANGGDNGYDSGIAQESNDGADSGAEVIKALSIDNRGCGGGSSSSGSDRFTPFQSCGSSLISYSSEPEIDRGSECDSESSGKFSGEKGSDRGSSGWKAKKAIHLKAERCRTSNRTGCGNGCGADGTSESCSETSSTHEPVTPDSKPSSGSNARFLDVKNRETVGKTSCLRASDSRARDKPSPRSRTSTPSATQKVAAKPSAVKSVIHAKGIKCKTDDGRSSSSQRNQATGARSRVSSAADPLRKTSNSKNSTVMSSSATWAPVGEVSRNGIPEPKSNALDKYGTLPRRAKKKNSDPSLSVSVVRAGQTRSSSASREPSLNRTATLRNQRSIKEKENSSACSKTLPPYPRIKKPTSKTVIYHEVGVQTVITREDMNGACSGICKSDKNKESVGEKENKQVQTEGKEKLKKIEEEFARQSEEFEKIARENEKLKTERRKMMSKISKMLGQPEEKEEWEENGENGLEELEMHFQVVGLTVIKQQEELSELRRYKLIAHRDLEKSLAAQKNLLQQQQEIEEEYSELQEFLQAEKSTLSESLLDTEEELKRLMEEVATKESLLEQQQEECKHLVRICEQRRQENLSLEAKLNGLDQRSRDVLVQQGAAVSAAAVALSGLGARLDTLVEQLSASCEISEKDLEDVIFHNEAYNQSEDDSPEDSPATIVRNRPKSKDSFLRIIVEAIRNAAQSPFSKKNSTARRQSDRGGERSEFFTDADAKKGVDFEQIESDENYFRFPNAPDSEISTSVRRTLEEKKLENDGEGDKQIAGFVDDSDLSRSDSLRNLTDAILNRQLIEKKERSVSPEKMIPIEVNSLVDQIIEVDNSVTKLLKVVRIVQERNEKFVEDILGERAALTGNLHREKLNRQNSEMNLRRLQKELTEARSQLNVRIAQLEDAKSFCGNGQRIAVVEMQKRFAIIDTALGALNSVQDMVNKCPPLARLRQDLEDCNFENGSPEKDVNANSSGDGSSDSNLNVNGAVLAATVN